MSKMFQKSLSLLLILLPSVALGTPLDSTRCPLKYPFSIIAHVTGLLDLTCPEDATSNYYGTGTSDIKLVIDPGDPSHTLSYASDILSWSSIAPSDTVESLAIRFNLRGDSVISLDFSRSDIFDYIDEKSENIRMQLWSMKCDSNSITFGNGGYSYSKRESWQEFRHIIVHFYGELTRIDTFALSGIFHPLPLSVAATPLLDGHKPSVQLSRGLTVCSFDPSDHSRTVEVYSALGVKIGSVNISPGQSSIILPPYAAGIYFIRLDGAIAKAYVPPQ